MAVKILKVIDDRDLQKLQNESKCCIIVNGLVFDVTSFYEHPGGYDLFKEYEGKDATAAFNEIGHSVNAKKLMKNYLIGIMKNSDRYKNKINTRMVEDKVEYIEYSAQDEEEGEETAAIKPELDQTKDKVADAEKVNYPMVSLIILLFSIAYYYLFLKG
ncbi:cytochrome b5 [Plasmodium brasilianum]|uniref:Cytochrome b5, putative n=2 Tax=Plasmodium (Plasmodium) TaxID=418103 RepID=A0A1C3L347_PLAMA|nr:cytochrome b5, putative [Plasmodium malariae]KAI4835030.1 cytochrome b5 [Plasmodium brasilianum]SBT81002.1 cytochrome b5, putative [Plasmodium malariae]SCP03606.1 cytochrome b5, putative [Plasmodium malariae]